VRKPQHFNLYSIVGRYAKSGGSIDAPSLSKQVGGLIVDEKIVGKNEEKEEFSRAEKFLNKMVYKHLATLNANRNSPYSISLKTEDGRFINELPYVKQAEKYLLKRRVYVSLKKCQDLVSRYNTKASETVRTLQQSIQTEMQTQYATLKSIQGFNVNTRNSYSYQSLLELLWNYCEQKEESEIVKMSAVNFSKIRNSAYGWILSRTLRGLPIQVDYNIITSDKEAHAEPDTLIHLLKSIGSSNDNTTYFSDLQLMLSDLNESLREFKEKITDLGEEIDLESIND
jgi:hypothetical protein